MRKAVDIAGETRRDGEAAHHQEQGQHRQVRVGDELHGFGAEHGHRLRGSHEEPGPDHSAQDQRGAQRHEQQDEDPQEHEEADGQCHAVRARRPMERVHGVGDEHGSGRHAGDQRACGDRHVRFASADRDGVRDIAKAYDELHGNADSEQQGDRPEKRPQGPLEDLGDLAPHLSIVAVHGDAPGNDGEQHRKQRRACRAQPRGSLRTQTVLKDVDLQVRSLREPACQHGSDRHAEYRVEELV